MELNNFSKAQLDGSAFSNAELIRTNFTEITAQMFVAREARFHQCSFAKSKIALSDFAYSLFEDSDFSNTVLHRVSMQGVIKNNTKISSLGVLDEDRELSKADLWILS